MPTANLPIRAYMIKGYDADGVAVPLAPGETAENPILHREPAEPGGNLTMTGPVRGVLTMTDGTVYDASPDWISVRPEHVGEFGHHQAVAAQGLVPGHTHVCTDECGAAKNPAPQA